MENRKVIYPNRFDVTKTGGTGTFITGTKTVTLKRVPVENGEEGTLLTKELLESCFNEKQDKLYAAENGGLVFTEEADGKVGIGVDFENSNISEVNYANIAPQVSSNDFTVNYEEWSALQNIQPTYTQNEQFSIALGDHKYRSARVDFKVKNVEWDTASTLEPMVFVKFTDGTNSTYCVGAMAERKLKLVQNLFAENQSVLQQASFSNTIENEAKITVIRSAKNAAGYSYLVLINGVYACEFETTQPKTTFENVEIGLANCMGEIEKWQIHGEF